MTKTPNATPTKRKTVDRSKMVKDTRPPEVIFNDRFGSILPHIRRQLSKLSKLGHSRAVPTPEALQAAQDLIRDETENALRELGYKLTGKQTPAQMAVPDALRVTIAKPTKPKA